MSAVIPSKHLILVYLDVAREKEITDSKNAPKIQTYFSSPTCPALGWVVKEKKAPQAREMWLLSRQEKRDYFPGSQIHDIHHTEITTQWDGFSWMTTPCE